MSDEDKTRLITDSSEATPPTPPTQPTIETILERINQFGESLSAETAKIRTDLSAEIAKVRTDLSTEIQAFRDEVRGQFSLLNKKIDILNRELLDVRAMQEQHEDRIDELERQAS